MPTQAELNQQMAELLTRWLTRENEQVARENGVVNGGPNGNGMYPVTAPDGTVSLVPCPRKIAQIAASLQAVALSGPGPHTLTPDMVGNAVEISNAGVTPVVVVVPSVAPGALWFVRQTGTAPLKFTSTLSLRSRVSANGTAGLWAAVSLQQGTGANLFLDGDVGSVS